MYIHDESVTACPAMCFCFWLKLYTNHEVDRFYYSNISPIIIHIGGGQFSHINFVA